MQRLREDPCQDLFQDMCQNMCQDLMQDDACVNCLHDICSHLVVQLFWHSLFRLPSDGDSAIDCEQAASPRPSHQEDPHGIVASVPDDAGGGIAGHPEGSEKHLQLAQHQH